MILSVWVCTTVAEQELKPADPPGQTSPRALAATPDESLSKKLDRTDGVLVPPNVNTDPEIRVAPPDGNIGTMRVIPPPPVTSDGGTAPPK